MNLHPQTSSSVFLASLGFFLMVALFAPGCSNEAPSHDPVYLRLFRDDSTAFRGVDPGDALSEVKRYEDAGQILHEDELGLSYRIPLNDKEEMLIDYHSDNLQTELSSNRLASIVANVLLIDEIRTAKLYNEVQVLFNERYGVANGSYGDLRWEGLTRHLTPMEIILRMDDSKKGLTLNFVDMTPPADRSPF